MKKHFQNFVYWSGIIFLGIISGFILKFSSAWVEPTDGGNILTPLNTGPLPQSKSGGLLLNVGGAPTGLVVDKGLVGIGTTAPKGALDVTSKTNGFLPPRMTTAERNAILSPEPGLIIFNTDLGKFNGFNGGSWVTIGGETTPSGTIAYFDLSSCPAGWSELTDARGRYIVGKPNGGTIGWSSEVGQALSNMENRPVGQHNHTAWQDPHQHLSYYEWARIQRGNWIENATCCCSWFGWTGSWTGTDWRQPAVHVDNAGSVPGTNAPYIQFLACKKN